MSKTYIATGTKYTAPRRRSWEPKTQMTQVAEAVAAAGANGTTREEIVAKTGIVAANVVYYLNKLSKLGVVVAKGGPAAAANIANMSADAAMLVALDALENALSAQFNERPITDDARGAFKTYQKCKATALGAFVPGASKETKNEARVGLRMAVVALVKAVI